MNPKIERLDKDIQKTKEKINELSTRLILLETQKIEAENTEILALVRSLSMTPAELIEWLTLETTPQKPQEKPKEATQEKSVEVEKENFYGEA